MSKALIESLQIDLPALAQLIKSKGRGRDTVLAHITPKEAALLKKRGGSGTINPDTGLPQFDDEIGGYQPAAEPAAVQPSAPVSPVYDIIQPSGAISQVDPNQMAKQYTAGGASYAPTSGYADIPNQPQSYIGAVQDAEDLAAGPSAGAVPAGQQITGGYYPGATAYAPTQLTPAQLSQVSLGESPYAPAAPSAPTTPTTTTKTDQEKILGMSPDTLARLGLTGLLGTYGVSQARKGTGQIQAATQEQQAIAQPYQTQGQELVRAAQAGELTPSSMQSYKAAQAQLQQQIATRGGVGAEQAATQLEALRQNLLQNQYNYGLQVSQIGDQIALGAIRTGMQLDQQLNTASNQFYTSLASIAAGLPMRIA
jgi:hypothetical protein